MPDLTPARLVEDLAAHAAPATPRPGLRAAQTDTALAYARTCYDHLAGRLGVAVLDALVARGLVDRTRGLAVTADGLHWLAGLGVDVPALQRARRPVVRECLDWTERRPHLAGGAGAALCGHFTGAGWLRRRADGRALLVTPAGRLAFADLLGIDA